MARWRVEAIERLPEFREAIASAESVMALWIELSAEFLAAYRQQPRNESLIARIYSYANWCVAAPRGPDAGHDPLTAVAAAFYEHIPTRKPSPEDMPRWFLASEVEAARSTFSYLLDPGEFEALLKHLKANAGKYRGREARVRRALEEVSQSRESI